MPDSTKQQGYKYELTQYLPSENLVLYENKEG